jgi:predicted N-formylglutamate amidohydrolase
MPEHLLIVTCEHGGSEVPERYRHLFRGAGDLLATHRGWDIGILPLARRFASELDSPLHAAEVTRLLVDLNRSPGNRTLFSEFTAPLPPAQKNEILELYYHPYRREVEERVALEVAAGRTVLHLSIHSFTPELRGKVRHADLGLLYDPSRPPESEFCRRWQSAIRAAALDLRVRLNYPYRGTSDSLVSFLHRRHPPESYLGIELEVNQALPTGEPGHWERVQEVLLMTLRGLLE